MNASNKVAEAIIEKENLKNQMLSEINEYKDKILQLEAEIDDRDKNDVYKDQELRSYKEQADEYLE